VEIFLLNPESPLTRERSESAKDPSKSPAEIKSTEDDVKEGIERNLDLLAERVKRYPDYFDKRLKVRIYDSLPSVSVYRADDYYTIGLFMHGVLADDNIQFFTDKIDAHLKKVCDSEMTHLTELPECLTLPVDKLKTWRKEIGDWQQVIEKQRQIRLLDEVIGDWQQKTGQEKSEQISFINLYKYEDELINRFRNQEFFHVIGSISEEEFLKMLIQRRFLSLEFTKVYDMIIDVIKDDYAKIIARKILREEYPNSTVDDPGKSHRELLIQDFNILKASMGIEDSTCNILTTRQTSTTRKTIESTFALIMDNSNDELSDIKLLTLLRFWGEVLVAAEYEEYWEKRMSNYFFKNAENPSKFYYEHYEHDRKKEYKEKSQSEASHSDEIGRRLLDMIKNKTKDETKALEAFIEMERKVLGIKSYFYKQFVDQPNAG
jgi:hypothetical protein